MRKQSKNTKRILITEGAFSSSIAESLRVFGNNCIIVKYNSKNAEKYFNYLHFYNLIVISGGGDVDPKNYFEKNRSSYSINKERDKFEMDLVLKSLKMNRKLLGICRGHQLINIALGGTLYQDLEEIGEYHNTFGNYHPLKKETPGIVPSFFCHVNSLHHQAVKDVGFLLRVTSSYNNCIESTENEQIITVQFHPEIMKNNDSLDFFSYISYWSKIRGENIYKEFL